MTQTIEKPRTLRKRKRKKVDEKKQETQYKNEVWVEPAIDINAFKSQYTNQDNIILERNEPDIELSQGETLMSNEDYATELYQIYKSYFQKNHLPTLEVGAIVQARVVSINSGKILLNGNFKDLIRCDAKNESQHILDKLKVGSLVEVTIVDIQHQPYQIIGNISQQFYYKVGKEARDLVGTDEAVDAIVKEWQSAGYYLDLSYKGVMFKAFMPNTISGVNKLPDPEALVGQHIKVILDSYSDDTQMFIASRKRFLELQINEEAKQLEIGVEYEGTVTGAKDFGVFVQFHGCLTGMIHPANLNEEWQKKMSGIHPGMKIPFKVKEVILDKDPAKTKIILTQVDRESIWDNIEIDNNYEGQITKEIKFGLLVHLDAETMGVIHKNELEKYPDFNPQPGEKVNVKVASFDRRARKIFLLPN